MLQNVLYRLAHKTKVENILKFDFVIVTRATNNGEYQECEDNWC